MNAMPASSFLFLPLLGPALCCLHKLPRHAEAFPSLSVHASAEFRSRKRIVNASEGMWRPLLNRAST